MIINTREELDILLEQCKAIPYSEPRMGGSFYKVMAQDFAFPDGSIQMREYLDKKPASVAVPLTDDGNLVFVVQPIALSREGSLLEFPAGYWEIGERGTGAGVRELGEETGYYPEEIEYLGYHYQDPGGIKQKVDVYLMKGCKNLGLKKLDRGEFCREVEMPFTLAMELLDEGYFSDANSFIALTKTERYLRRNYIKESGFVLLKNENN